MKKRNLVFMIVMSVITLGIYTIYWLYATRKELVAKGAKIPPLVVALLPALGLLAIALLQVMVSASSDGQTIRTFVNIIAVLLGLASLIGLFILPVYWWHQYSKGVDKVTNGKISFDLSFWLGIILFFVGLFFLPAIMPAILQNEFNKKTA